MLILKILYLVWFFCELLKDNIDRGIFVVHMGVLDSFRTDYRPWGKMMYKGLSFKTPVNNNRNYLLLVNIANAIDPVLL